MLAALELLSSQLLYEDIANACVFYHSPISFAFLLVKPYGVFSGGRRVTLAYELIHFNQRVILSSRSFPPYYRRTGGGVIILKELMLFITLMILLLMQRFLMVSQTLL